MVAILIVFVFVGMLVLAAYYAATSEERAAQRAFEKTITLERLTERILSAHLGDSTKEVLIAEAHEPGANWPLLWQMVGHMAYGGTPYKMPTPSKEAMRAARILMRAEVIKAVDAAEELPSRPAEAITVPGMAQKIF